MARVMRLLVAIAAVLVSATAWATGERVAVNGADNPLRETLCYSMQCVTHGPRDASVQMRRVKAGVVFTVTTATGRVRLTHFTKASADGRVSSIDLVRATSLVVQAIERGPVQGDAPPTVARRPHRKARSGGDARLLAHR